MDSLFGTVKLSLELGIYIIDKSVSVISTLLRLVGTSIKYSHLLGSTSLRLVGIPTITIAGSTTSELLPAFVLQHQTMS